MSLLFDRENDPNEFTFELMIAILGEQYMLFDDEIKERHNKHHNEPNNMKTESSTMKERFESAKAQSESKPQCPAPEKSSSKER